MERELLVLGQDPRFGGGGLAQTEAFLRTAEDVGLHPSFMYDAHPAFGASRLTWRRIEALRQISAAERLAVAARTSTAIWVVATLAQHGFAAVRARRTYRCWIGTTIASEWRGRAPGLSSVRRVAAAASIRPLRELERRVLRGAERIYATSAASRTEIAAVTGRDDVGILPIPVDTTHFHPDLDWPPLEPTIVFVGRASDPRKNIDLLLNAAVRLPEVRVRLIGEPPRRALPANVEAIGFADDLPAAFHGATMFVLPSRQEGFAIVAAEALAAGLPVVTTPSGGPEEMVRVSGGGRVLSGFSTEELVDTVRALLSDEMLLSQMRSSGRAYVEREHSQARFRELLLAAVT